MSEEIKEILEQLKDSVDYPKFDMPTFDGTDSEFIDNDTLLEPDKCKLLLDYITNLQQKVEQLEKENKELNRMCELYSQSLYNADLTKAEKKVEQLENIRKEAIKWVKLMGKYENGSCTRNFKLMSADFNYLLNILNKGDNNVKDKR